MDKLDHAVFKAWSNRTKIFLIAIDLVIAVVELYQVHFTSIHPSIQDQLKIGINMPLTHCLKDRATFNFSNVL
jgi:hypothetical protein